MQRFTFGYCRALIENARLSEIDGRVLDFTELERRLFVPESVERGRDEEASGELRVELQKCISRELWVSASWTLLRDFGNVGGPLAAWGLLSQLGDASFSWSPETTVLFGLLAVTQIASSIGESQASHTLYIAGLYIQRSLNSRFLGRMLAGRGTVGEPHDSTPVGSFAVDLRALLVFLPHIHFFWSAALKVATGTALLWSSAMGGLGPWSLIVLGAVLAQLVLQGWLSGKLQSSLGKARRSGDERVKEQSEVLDNYSYICATRELWRRPLISPGCARYARDEGPQIARFHIYSSVAMILNKLIPLSVYVLSLGLVAADYGDSTSNNQVFAVFLAGSILHKSLIQTDYQSQLFGAARVALDRLGAALRSRVHAPETAADVPAASDLLQMLDSEDTLCAGGRMVVVVGESSGGLTRLLQSVVDIAASRKHTPVARVGYLEQDPWILDSATLRENVTLADTVEDGELRYRAALQGAGLDDFEVVWQLGGDERKLSKSTLSGGQRKRIGIARLLYVEDPSLLVLDTPFSGLDVKLGNHVAFELLAQSKHKKILLTATTGASELGVLANLATILRMEAGTGALRLCDVGISPISPESKVQVAVTTPETTRTPEPEREITTRDLRLEPPSLGVFDVLLMNFQMGGVWSASSVVCLVISRLLSICAYRSLKKPADGEFEFIKYGLGEVAVFVLGRGVFGVRWAVTASRKTLREVWNGFFSTNWVGGRNVEETRTKLSRDMFEINFQMFPNLQTVADAVTTLMATVALLVIPAGDHSHSQTDKDVQRPRQWLGPFAALVAIGPGFILALRTLWLYLPVTRRLRDEVVQSSVEVMAVFSEAAKGGNTLRVLGQTSLLEDRLRVKNKTQFLVGASQYTVQKWFYLRMDMAGMIAILMVPFVHEGSPALQLTAAMQIVDCFRYIGTIALLEQALKFGSRVYELFPVSSLPASGQVAASGSANIFPRAALEIRGLTLRYWGRQQRAVEDVSFTADGGTVVGLVGKSGSGKSSILKALLGLETQLFLIEEGEINTGGKPVVYMAQDSAIFSGSLAFNVDPAGVATAEQLQFALAITGLLDRYSRDAWIETASMPLGDQQLAGLARVILLCASDSGSLKVVALDEPTASLGEEFERVFENILDYLRSQGHTVLLVAHKLRAVVSVCDQVVVLENGRVLEIGSPRDLLLQKSSKFAAMAELSHI